jgi:hypothetical protein
MSVGAGGLTVRKVETPSGIGMTREAKAGGRKAAGIPTHQTALLAGVGPTGRIGARCSSLKGR